MITAFFLAAYLGSTSSAIQQCSLVAELRAPTTVPLRGEFKIWVTVRNGGPTACRFVKYWKWTYNRMFLELQDSKGATVKSGPVLLDIDRAYDCFYVKGLESSDAYTFVVYVNGDFGSVPLPIRGAGSYRLKWRYIGDPQAIELCPTADTETWTGDLSSNSVDLVVVREEQ